MTGVYEPEYVAARAVLLDSLQVLESHLESLVLVGAHAVYLHTGSSGLAIAEFTVDADIAIRPNLISDDPLLGDLLVGGGFEPTPDLGRWINRDGLYLDLLVPDGVAGPARWRSAALGPHGRRIARRAAGLEAALVDHRRMVVTSLEGGDRRAFTINVAGPAALLVAKTTKIQERMGQPTRLNDKDALDILRLLRTVPAQDIVSDLEQLLADPLARPTTVRALEAIPTLFTRPDSIGSQMAARSVQELEPGDTIASSMAVLARDVLDQLGM